MQRTLLQALALFVVSTLSANAMPPGWTKGCSNPVYGSPDAACAVALEQPGSFYIADTVNGVCRFFNADGASIGQQFICPSCPSGFHVDANSNCSPNASFAGLDPFANVGSGAQSALTVSAASAQPLLVDDSINAATGNKYEREVDYEGAGPFPLTFVRYYNSQFTYQSQLGLSWRHNYDRQVLIEDASHVVVVRPEGQAFEFVLSNGSWASVNDPVDRLQSTAGGWVLINQADEIETYTASGQLTSITNRAGLTQTLFYSDAGTPASIAPQPGLLIKVTDPAGRELRFAYDLRRLLQTMRDAAGNLYTYSYNRQGSLTQVSYPGSASARIYRYAFAGINPFLANTLTGIVDENGNDFAAFGYDTGTARAVSSKLGGALSADPYTLKYNSNGTTSITDAFTTRVYGFQSVLGLAHLSSVSHPCTGCSANFAARAYDASGFVASSTDFNGNLTTYQRNDSFSRPDLETARTEAVGKPEARTITTEWEATWRLPRRIAEPLRITSFTYDSQGNVLARTVQPTADANGAQGLAAAAAGTPGTWTYAYSYSPTVIGLITQLVVDGPRTDLADTTTYAWDSAGNLISVTNALGHVTTFDDYDAHGRPRQILDANGLVTTLAYDQRGRLIARDAGGEHTGYAYDAAGQLKTSRCQAAPRSPTPTTRPTG
jgi:YD repeat-containing protein